MPADPTTSTSGEPASSQSDDFVQAGGGSAGVSSAGAGESGGGGAGSGGGDASQSSGAPAVPTRTWRDDAKNYGLDLSKYEKDEDAFKYLAERHQTAAQVEAARREAEQAKQLAQYGNEYLQYAPQFRAWFAEQQKALAAQQQQADVDPYARPEYDPRWETLVEYDANGALVPNLKAGGTPDIVQKVQQQLQWRRGFLAEPEKYLERSFKAMAKEQAKALFDEQINELKREFAAQNFLLTNRHWLYKAGANGMPTAELSEDGEWVRGQLETLNKMGLSDEQQQHLVMHMLAEKRKLTGAAAQATTQTQQASAQQTMQQAADASKADFLKTAAGHGASPAASTQAPLGANGQSQNSNLSLDERLRKAFKANGVDESTLANIR